MPRVVSDGARLAPIKNVQGPGGPRDESLAGQVICPRGRERRREGGQEEEPSLMDRAHCILALSPLPSR